MKLNLKFKYQQSKDFIEDEVINHYGNLRLTKNALPFNDYGFAYVTNDKIKIYTYLQNRRQDMC